MTLKSQLLIVQNVWKQNRGCGTAREGFNKMIYITADDISSDLSVVWNLCGVLVATTLAISLTKCITILLGT